VIGGQDARRVRVLIVEDDRRVRAALCGFVSVADGFEVVAAAGDATQAVDLARAHPDAVALVDLLLPRPDMGLELLRTLTGELGMPAVALSVRPDLADKALAAGACRFVEKHGAPDALLTALRAAASSSHA
jgi:DNA-binding NarL/FixJ family response regulator